ncbi:hypothetical protein ACNT2N_11470 [Pseudomonas thivervalensis]|uniref:Uncharacterized protein n=1 Tax=Pseudomonas thivervalensis TaxID=86265 RepID=A0A2Z4ZBB3_9PSED|nr:hypothetical protein [Pseudomonas thivervalensis]AXA55243.1 hypothetical protein CE140_13040 [Pseudomonas thivervalensis]AXA60930.1 hypothetical protein CEQ51_12910 [Pseudomonas thivervalensis]
MNNPPHIPEQSQLAGSTEQETLHEYYDKQIQALEAAPSQQNKTRFILKVTNNSEHALNVSEHSLNLNADILASLQLSEKDVIAFAQDFPYVRKLGSPSKTLYRHFIVFGDQTLGARVEFGLRVNTSFGVFTPTITPVRTCKVTSIGSTPIACSARITRALQTDPYSFSMEVTLG